MTLRLRTEVRSRESARLGGLDLSDVSYPEPCIPVDCATSERTIRQGRSATSAAEDVTSSKDTNTIECPHTPTFEQTLCDHGVYVYGYTDPATKKLPPKPANFNEIKERLRRRRPSLEPEVFTEADFEKFQLSDVKAKREKALIQTVLPVIEGKIEDNSCMGGDYRLGNLAPIVDVPLAKAVPDHFFGSMPVTLNPAIRQKLNTLILPSCEASDPMLPNFFLELKTTRGFGTVAIRQASYHGALGARAMHALQSYKRDEPIYDNNAYTITTIYQGGQLLLYTSHLTAPRESDGRSQYITSAVNGFSISSDLETFVAGVTAYRNARDWAREQREEFIRTANERYAADPQSEHSTAADPVDA